MPLFYGVKVNFNFNRLPYLPIEWIELDKLHITILYIGNSRVPKEAIDEIQVKLSSIPCFKVTISKELIFLPSKVRPKVIGSPWIP